MKKAIYMLTLLAAFLFCLSSCGKNKAGKTPTETTQTPAATEPEPQSSQTKPTVQYPDPFPEEAYDSYRLGKRLDTMDDVNVIKEHEQNGTVYHIVYDNPMKIGPLPVQCIYRYPEFPSYSNEARDPEPVWFRGHQALYLLDTSGTGLPLPSEDNLVNITDPGIYGLLEDHVFPLTFASGLEQPSSLQFTVHFVTVDQCGEEASYIVYRDGSVTRNYDQVATEKLSEPVTAYLFAIKAVHGFATRSSTSYGNINDFAEPEPVVVLVHMDGQERELTAQESRDFIKLVSDAPEDGVWSDYSFNSFVRTNCGPGSHGEQILKFTLAQHYADGETRALMTCSLFSDGKVVCKSDYVNDFRSDFAILDRLIVDRFLVSETGFDVQAILDFLNRQSNAG